MATKILALSAAPLLLALASLVLFGGGCSESAPSSGGEKPDASSDANSPSCSSDAECEGAPCFSGVCSEGSCSLAKEADGVPYTRSDGTPSLCRNGSCAPPCASVSDCLVVQCQSVACENGICSWTNESGGPCSPGDGGMGVCTSGGCSAP